MFKLIDGDIEVITSVVNTRRLVNTSSGNPRWEITTRHGMYQTADDSDCGQRPWDVWMHPPRPQVKVVVRRQKIVYAERIGE